MYKICKTVKFDAAHQLGKNMTDKVKANKIYGKCTRLHGHSYRVAVYVVGDRLCDDMLINFSVLKKIMKKVIINRYDHNTLNDVMEVETTAENIAKEIFENVIAELNMLTHANVIHLQNVRVWETDTCWAEYNRMM